MAFRETDRAKTGDPTRRVARGWLRAVLIEDWSLKLLAFAITLGLWYGVTSQRAPASRRVSGVQLSFLRPEDVEISNEPIKQVEVTLQGGKNALNEIIASNLVATVDVSNRKLGERVVPLTNETVSINLPDGVRIEKIEPSTVALRLERRIERTVPVKERLEGRLPEGFELRGVQITPAIVRVRGPESHVNAMDRVLTETISLDAQTQSLTLQQTAIDIMDPKVIALDATVTVRLDIVEQRVERSLEGVAVRVAGGDQSPRPSRVSVRVRGTRSVVESLSAEKLELVLERAPDGSLRPRLLLPPGVPPERVELISTNPSDFSINR